MYNLEVKQDVINTFSLFQQFLTMRELNRIILISFTLNVFLNVIFAKRLIMRINLLIYGQNRAHLFLIRIAYLSSQLMNKLLAQP